MNYTQTCDNFAQFAKRKAEAMKRAPLSLLAGCMLAGAYIGIALILALTCSAGLPAGVRPLVTGSVFGIGLLLVLFAGADMYTGYVMYVVFGVARRTISLIDATLLLVFVWVGNLIGGALFAWLYTASGGGVVFSTPNFLHDYVMHKEVVGWVPLLAKATLCNWLVCLAIWTPARLQSESAKILALAWCLLAFVACGFEHSVANMTAVLVGLMAPVGVGFGTPALAAYNLAIVTLGNFIGGGVLVAGAYLLYAGADQDSAPQKPVERTHPAHAA
jgi:nitrite transporter NirC